MSTPAAPAPRARLDDLVAGPHTAEATSEATDRIMAAITGIVEDLRGGTAPAERFDPRQRGLRETGNPQDDTTTRRKQSR